MTEATKGLEQTLKDIIKIRIVQRAAKFDSNIVDSADMRTMMVQESQAVYGPIMEIVKSLAEEVGLALENAKAAIILPDTLDTGDDS